jgi:hypothetical protein
MSDELVFTCPECDHHGDVEEHLQNASGCRDVQVDANGLYVVTWSMRLVNYEISHYQCPACGFWLPCQPNPRALAEYLLKENESEPG